MAGYSRGSKGEAGRVLGSLSGSIMRLRHLGQPQGARTGGAAGCVGEGSSSQRIIWPCEAPWLSPHLQKLGPAIEIGSHVISAWR